MSRQVEVDMPRLARYLRVSAALLFVCAPLLPAHAWAQTPRAGASQTIAADPPAHVSYVDGAAVLERDGQPDSAPLNMPLLAGDRLRTQGGRVEILFADGSTLHLDANTTLDFQSDELVRLLDGRLRLAIPGPDRRVAYRVDAPSASAIVVQPGEYKVSVLHSTRDGEIELAVLRGAAELVNDHGRTALRAGERAYATASTAPSYAYTYNSASWDAFDQWSEMRRDQRLGLSTQYLPDEVRAYGPVFDQYGTWQYQSSYGYVWYPTVAAGWRPYYRGRWVTMHPYGWTWVGVEPFAWPTHHFGRWGFSAGTWFWIPGATWGPAWVSWAYAPGYVSWCPLDWNNHAVFQINVYSGAYSPWTAWTVVPRPYFGVGYVHAHYVHHVDPHVWQTSTPRSTAPATTGYAVPRSAAPIRAAGAAPPQRTASTVYTNLSPGVSRVSPGGRRVIVGDPRNTLAPPAAAELRSPGDSYAVRRATPPGVPAVTPESVRRSFGAPGQIDGSGDPNAGRAVPRDPMYRSSMPSAPVYGFDRPLSPSSPPETMYGGVAVPRQSPGAAGSGTESRPPGGFDRHAPPAPPSGPPPAARGGDGDGRGGGDRGQGGGDRGQGGGPPPAAAGGAGGGHTRGGPPAGGQPTGGRAVPRGRG